MQYSFRPNVLADYVDNRALAPHDAILFDMARKCAAAISSEELLSRAAATPART
ncbi:isochorismatase hydrolase [Caballeronia fortuita]|uniref:Isochorismatase hydrolase n=1 Tax=Caballeronia fortuita TaxID=1777138 RepID=A0A158EAA5_9BURK|nr:isochorismatase hydrolase [Caballeronia fortuita]